MKKLLIALFAVSLLVSCGNDNLMVDPTQKPTPEEPTQKPDKDLVEDQDNEFTEDELSYYLDGGPHYKVGVGYLLGSKGSQCIGMEVVSADGNEAWIELEKETPTSLPTMFSVRPNFTGVNRHALLCVEYKGRDGLVKKELCDVPQRTLRKKQLNHYSYRDTVISATAHRIEFSCHEIDKEEDMGAVITQCAYNPPLELNPEFDKNDYPERPLDTDPPGWDNTKYLVEGTEFYCAKKNNVVIAPGIPYGVLYDCPVVGKWSYYTKCQIPGHGHINSLNISENTSGNDRVIQILQTEWLIYRVTQKATK